MAPTSKQSEERRQAERDAALLGYDPRWIDFGLVDAAYLRAQAELYERGEDVHTEHYRHRGFLDFFARCEHLSDAQLSQYVQIVASGDRDALYPDPLYQLLRFPGLTDAQLEWLSSHGAFGASGLQRLATRTEILRRFERAPHDEALIEPVLASADTQLQRRIVEHPQAGGCMMRRLADEGASKAIRNLARSRSGIDSD